MIRGFSMGGGGPPVIPADISLDTWIATTSSFGTMALVPGSADIVLDTLESTSSFTPYLAVLPPPSLYGSLVTSVTKRAELSADFGVTIYENSDSVSGWATQEGTTVDFAQGAAFSQPSYAVDLVNRPAVIFDGIASFMTTAVSFPAPATTPSYFFAVLTVVDWNYGGVFWSASSGGTLVIVMREVVPELRALAPDLSEVHLGATVDGHVTLEAFFNSEITDFLAAGSAAPTTGIDLGNRARTGFRLGTNSTTDAFAGYALRRWLVCNGLPTVAERNALKNRAQADYAGQLTIRLD